MRMTLIRADLDTLPAYVPGRTIPGAIKLASNEVSLPPTPPVLAAIAQAAAVGNRYPDLAVTGLTARLAEVHKVDAARIAVGCGSVSLCQQLVQATCLEPPTRWYSPGARSRLTRSSPRSAAPRRARCRWTPTSGTTSTRWPPPSGRAAGW